MTTNRLNITSPSFDTAEIEATERCLKSGWVTQGPLIRQFQKIFAARHQVRHAVAANSCTAALHLATLSLQLGPSDEVIVPAFTWVTSAHCAEQVGAKVVLADIQADSFNLDPKTFEAAITSRTRAVVLVHLFGQAADINAIRQIADRHQIRIIEDAACAVGTEYDGVPVGGTGDVGCFSFHPRKVITTGGGGMLTTNDDRLAEKIQPLRSHGRNMESDSADAPRHPYTMGTFDVLGLNMRLTDIQAAVGIGQMGKLDRLLVNARAAPIAITRCSPI